MRARARALNSTTVLVVALWLLWSTAFLAIKVGLHVADPLSFTLLRVGAAVAALGVWRALRGRPPGGRPPLPHRWALFLGATNVAGFLVFQNLGLLDAPVGVGAVILYTQPMLVAVGAWCLRGEGLRTSQVVGLLLGWSGVVVLVAGELQGHRTPPHAIAYLLVSAVAWAAGTVGLSAVPRSVPVLDVLLLMNVYGDALVLLVMATGLGPQTHVHWGTTVVLTVLWAGVGASAGGIAVQFLLLRRGKAAVVSSWTFAIPVLAVAEGSLLLGEPVSTSLIAGSITVTAAIWVVNRRGSRAQPEPTHGFSTSTEAHGEQ